MLKWFVCLLVVAILVTVITGFPFFGSIVVSVMLVAIAALVRGPLSRAGVWH